MISTPPAGWYNDPSGAVGTLRYWDGTTWTGHTHTVAAPPPAPPSWQGPPLVNYGRRLGGWLIDWLLVSVVSSAVIAITHSYRHPSTTYLRNGVTVHSWDISIGWKGLLIDAALAIAYGTVMCGSARGQTLGMMCVGARVVDLRTGTPIGYARALGRGAFEYLMTFVLLIPWIVDMLFPLWDPMRQTLHDKVVSSIVINASGNWVPGG